jgi:hypothetical protein
MKGLVGADIFSTVAVLKCMVKLLLHLLSSLFLILNLFLTIGKSESVQGRCPVLISDYSARMMGRIMFTKNAYHKFFSK